MANALQDYQNQKAKQQPQGFNPLQGAYQAIHNFGQGVDQLGSNVYNGIRNATMGFDQTFGIPDSRITQQLLSPLGMQYNSAAQPTPTPTAMQQQAPPMPSATPTPPVPNQLASAIQNGFLKWGNGNAPPAATLSASFARAGQGLPDPFMPAVLSLKETGGGRRLADANNLLNIQYNGIGHSPYEQPQYGIEGGGGHHGFPGVINNGMYNDYLKSGNLQDFFKVYTPHTDHNGNVINDSYDKQIGDYNKLRSYFTGH